VPTLVPKNSFFNFSGFFTIQKNPLYFPIYYFAGNYITRRLSPETIGKTEHVYLSKLWYEAFPISIAVAFTEFLDV